MDDKILNPRYPENLLTINAVSLNSSATKDTGGYDIVYPIGSISKSFCGVTCALMGAEGKFGKEGLNATLADVLKQALEINKRNPEKIKKIKAYKELLENKEIESITIKQILTHTSGIITSHENEIAKKFAREGKEIPILEYFQSDAFLGEDDRGESNKRKKPGNYDYSNDAYTLLAEVLNFVSTKGSFLQECKDRVINKLELSNTKTLEDMTEKEKKKTLGKGTEYLDFYQQGHPTGKMPIFTGGFCSTVNDLIKYVKEIGRLYLGEKNELANNEATKKISEVLSKDWVVPSWAPKNKKGETTYHGYGTIVNTKEGKITSISYKGLLASGNKSFVKVVFNKNKEVEKAICEFECFDPVAISLTFEAEDKIKSSYKKREERLVNIYEKMDSWIFQRYHKKDEKGFDIIDSEKLKKDCDSIEGRNEIVDKIVNEISEEIDKKLKEARKREQPKILVSLQEAGIEKEGINPIKIDLKENKEQKLQI